MAVPTLIYVTEIWILTKKYQDQMQTADMIF